MLKKSVSSTQMKDSLNTRVQHVIQKEVTVSKLPPYMKGRVSRKGETAEVIIDVNVWGFCIAKYGIWKGAWMYLRYRFKTKR